ncbi:MAG: hypothetical protein ACYC8T_29590 [Myxococcaceae bacterium]
MSRPFPTAPAALLLATFLWPSSAQAVPAFARRYSATCQMCHSAYPRLNDFGLRFRDYGYRIPGRETEEKPIWDTLPPLAGRANAGLDVQRFANTPGAQEVNRVQLNGLDFLAGGHLGMSAGFFLVYTPPIPQTRGTAEQAGSLEMANVVFADVLTRGLSVRVGRFEPNLVPFSVARRLSVAPYEIYDFTFPGGAPLGETQEGIELAGSRSSVRYALGWVNGASTLSSTDFPLDLYLRLAKVFGAGEGQTGGQRVGLTAELGRARPLSPPLPSGDRRLFYRLGLDASLNLSPLNLGVQGYFSSDRGELWGTAGPVNVFGGFAELTYQPLTDLVAFARFDGVWTPAGTGAGDITRETVGLRYYLAYSVALHAEYSHRNTTPDAREDSGTLRLDWAF